LGIKDKVKELLYTDSNNETNKHEHNFQELWDIINRPNLKIQGKELRYKLKTYENYSMKL
jgi:outer membrane receptor for ferrienterochelin and colicin